MKIDPKRLRLYAVTDRAWTHDAEGLLRQVAAAVDGVAVVSALFAQADVKAAAEELLRLLEEIAR